MAQENKAECKNCGNEIRPDCRITTGDELYVTCEQCGWFRIAKDGSWQPSPGGPPEPESVEPEKPEPTLSGQKVASVSNGSIALLIVAVSVVIGALAWPLKRILKKRRNERGQYPRLAE